MPENTPRDLWGQDFPPVEERWWEDPELDREQLLAGLARYALARDSRYDKLSQDTEKIAKELEKATAEVERWRKLTVRRDEVLLPAEIHSLRRRSLVYSAIFALFAVLVSTLFLVGEVVPRCFFVATGPHPAACDSIPGYSRSIADADERLRQQRSFIAQVPDNQRRIDQLEREVARLSGKPPQSP